MLKNLKIFNIVDWFWYSLLFFPPVGWCHLAGAGKFSGQCPNKVEKTEWRSGPSNTIGSSWTSTFKYDRKRYFDPFNRWNASSCCSGSNRDCLSKWWWQNGTFSSAMDTASSWEDNCFYLSYLHVPLKLIAWEEKTEWYLHISLGVELFGFSFAGQLPSLIKPWGNKTGCCLWESIPWDSWWILPNSDRRICFQRWRWQLYI